MQPSYKNATVPRGEQELNVLQMSHRRFEDNNNNNYDNNNNKEALIQQPLQL